MKAAVGRRPPRKALVALATEAPGGEPAASALVTSLRSFGFDVNYLGREACPRRLASAAKATQADAVELCISQSVPVGLVRELLRALTEVGRPETRIVLHRVA